MPCLSSGVPLVKPGVSLATTNQVGPSGVAARMVEKSAMEPLEIHCLRPLSRYAVTVPSSSVTGVAVVVMRAEVGAGIRLGRPVGEHDALLGDGPEPLLLLLLGGPDDDGVRAEEGREHGCGEADVLACHHLADPVGVERAAVHPAVLLGDEDQLHAEGHRVGHGAHDVLGAAVLVVELELELGRERGVDEVVERLQHEVQARQVEPCPAEVAVRLVVVGWVGRGGVGHRGPHGVRRGCGGGRGGVGRRGRADRAQQHLGDVEHLDGLVGGALLRRWATPSVSMIDAERAGRGDDVGREASASSVRLRLIRVPRSSSIHMRAPPAPQQNDRSAVARHLGERERRAPTPSSSRGGGEDPVVPAEVARVVVGHRLVDRGHRREPARRPRAGRAAGCGGRPRSGRRAAGTRWPGC